MVTIKISDSQFDAESIAVFVFQDDDQRFEVLAEYEKRMFPDLTEWLKKQHFSGKMGQLVSVPVNHDKKLINLLLLGLGKQNEKKFNIEPFRRVIGLLIKTLQAKKINSCHVQLPDFSAFGLNDVRFYAKQIAIISQMAAYRFDEYITIPERKVQKDVTLALSWQSSKDTRDEQKHKDFQKGLEEGSIIGHAVNKARYWVDLPPIVLTPTELSTHAKACADQYNLNYNVLSEEQVKKMGMGGLAGVSAGSDQDCKLVLLEYKAPKKNAPTLAFVGKGITFDSGGLSLKPPKYMETMKEDMSGAAAVIATMAAIGQLKPMVNVVAVMPLAENLPSGKALKPGDIVTFYNGKTAEVKNTDAEGRLILADALAYAVKHYKPDALFDIATLTGACAHALGPFFTGMMSKHEELMKKVEHAAELSGDRVWRLPFDDDFKKAIESPFADICNIGNESYLAGATTAGLFLSNFTEDTPWVHLDSAGTAFGVPDMSYYDRGATGVGVRLFIELICNW